MQIVRLPLVFPVLGKAHWRASYNENWGSHRHTGCDLRAPKLSPIVAPLSGTLGFKPQTFWIVREDGWGCLGTHLNDDTPGTRDGKANLDFMFAPNLFSGMKVQAGQLLGYVGDSGDARGPHLHFELHSPDGIRDPSPSLRQAQHNNSPLPLLTPSPYPGLLRLDGCTRGFDSQRRQLRVILIGEERAKGLVVMARQPEFRTLTMTPRALSELGDPAQLARDQVLSLYCQGSTVEYAAPLPVLKKRPKEPPKSLDHLGENHLRCDVGLTQCAATELEYFSQLTVSRWVRTGSMALGPLRMRGIRLKQAAILGIATSPEALALNPIVREALRHRGFTRFGAVLGADKALIVLADG